MVAISTVLCQHQFFPNDSIGIVVLVNQNGSAVRVVRNTIADRTQ